VNMSDADIKENSIDSTMVQAKERSGGIALDPTFDSQFNNLGEGKELSREERDFFEPRFGHDFSKVKIHDDNKANQLANAINARAFTKGNDILFGEGEYSKSKEGKELLAHELVHIVQGFGITNKNNDINRNYKSIGKIVEIIGALASIDSWKSKKGNAICDCAKWTGLPLKGVGIDYKEYGRKQKWLKIAHIPRLLDEDLVIYYYLHWELQDGYFNAHCRLDFERGITVDDEDQVMIKIIDDLVKYQVRPNQEGPRYPYIEFSLFVDITPLNDYNYRWTQKFKVVIDPLLPQDDSIRIIEGDKEFKSDFYKYKK
ncbi:MAG: DUF4157 domain-containing protein, partial [Candidatus Thorarchaeota archaeon]